MTLPVIRMPQWRCLPAIFYVVAALVSMSACASEAEAESYYQQGVERLRESQSNHNELVPATKLLAKAAELYEAAGNDTKGAEVNSCLYWAKKKLTLADTALLKDPAVTQRLAVAAKPVEISEAQRWLERADSFAQGHADDPLLVAIRYYEVGDRFKDSDAGRRAIDHSLQAMQKVGEKAQLAEYKPAPTDGKVYIQSDPPGASILLVLDDGKKDTGKKTPAMIQLPKGYQNLLLELPDMKPGKMYFEVTDSIAKPPMVKLEPLTVTIDLVFEAGWLVYIDKKPALDAGGKHATTPCSITAPVGAHTISLAKDGFNDIAQKVTMKQSGEHGVEIKTKPVKGQSEFLHVQFDWLVLFRSSLPGNWGRNSAEPEFAIDHNSVPNDIKYLKMTRTDTDEYVIIPMTRDMLHKEVEVNGQYGWCGTAELKDSGFHLGIFDTKRPKVKKEIEIAKAFHGWGFGHKTDVNKGTCCSWNGREIKNTIFEIAVKRGELTPEEQSKLLK